MQVFRLFTCNDISKYYEASRGFSATVAQAVTTHLFDKIVVVLGALFIIANEISQLRLFILERVVELLDLTDQINFLRRQTFPVCFHCYKHMSSQFTYNTSQRRSSCISSVFPDVDRATATAFSSRTPTRSRQSFPIAGRLKMRECRKLRRGHNCRGG